MNGANAISNGANAMQNEGGEDKPQKVDLGFSNMLKSVFVDSTAPVEAKREFSVLQTINLDMNINGKSIEKVTFDGNAPEPSFSLVVDGSSCEAANVHLVLENNGANKVSRDHNQKSQFTRWIVDSGASRTYTNNPDVLIPESVEKCEDHISKTAGGQYLRSKLIGNTKHLRNVIYIPQIDSNLISVGQLCDDIDARVVFDSSKVEVHHYGEVVMAGLRNRSSGLYEIGFGIDRAYHVANGGDGDNGGKMAPNDIILERFLDLHRKLGHLAFSQIKELINKGYLSKDKYKALLKVSNDVICRTCAMSKMASKPHKSAVGRHPNDRIGTHFSSDVCGPFPVQTPGGALYFITFIDRFSRFSFLYLMNNKSDAIVKFREFLGDVGRRMPPGHEVRILKTDNGGEYTSNEFENLLIANRIFHELTTPFSPESNGIAERLNRKMLEMVRCFLHESGLPRTYWGEAVRYANDL